MKKITLLLTPLFFAALITSCGPSQEEINAMNKKVEKDFDSLNKLADETIKENLRISDSIAKAQKDSLEKIK